MKKLSPDELALIAGSTVTAQDESETFPPVVVTGNPPPPPPPPSWPPPPPTPPPPPPPGGGGSSPPPPPTTGPEGSDADIWIKEGANISELTQQMLDTFPSIVSAWNTHGAPKPVITSGNDGDHSEGSLHYSNNALDLRANNITDAAAQQIADTLSGLVGDNYDVIFESFPDNPTRDHIHVEYDPSGG